MKKTIISILLGLFLATPCFGRDLKDNLQVYIRGNSNVDDYSGNGVTSTWAGDESYVSTPWGSTAMEFDGTGDTVATGSSFTLPTISITAWFKIDTYVNNDVILQYGLNGAGTNVTYRQTATTNQIQFSVKDTTFQAALEYIFTPGEWFFVAGTATANSYNFYVNGIFQEADTSGTMPTITLPIYIGANNVGGNLTDGDVAEVRVYNTILTADEINTLYQQTYPSYSQVEQPLNTLLDTSDSTLELAVLNRAVVGGKDLSSNSNDGTATDVVWESVGGEFNGSGSKIDTNATTISNTTFTVAAWINSDTQGSLQTIVSQWKSGTSNRLQFMKGTDNTINFTIGGSSKVATSAINANQWYYVVGTYNSTTLTLYLDGEYANSVAYSSGIEQDADTLIGTYSTGEYFNGKIKDARVYSEAKTASWIATEYAKGVPDDSLVLHVLDGDKDLSRYEHTLTNSGAVLGNGVILDGTNDSITVSDADSIDFDASEQYTWYMWVNASTVNDKRLSEKAVWSTNGYYIGFGTAGKLYFMDEQAVSSHSVRTTSIVPTNIYTQLVVTYDNGTVLLYINNAAAESETIGTPTWVDNTTSALTFADFNGNTGIPGTIIDYRVYNEVKSSDWVLAEYNRTKKYH